MRSHYTPRSSRLPIPGDSPVLDKYDPDQHKHDHLREYPRDVKPPYLTDREWEAIRIQPGQMLEFPEWDGKCTSDCCKEPDRDLH